MEVTLNTNHSHWQVMFTQYSKTFSGMRVARGKKKDILDAFFLAQARTLMK